MKLVTLGPEKNKNTINLAFGLVSLSPGGVIEKHMSHITLTVKLP